MVTYSDYVGDTRIMQYATALAERGDVVDVIGIGRPGAPAFEVHRGVNVHRIQSREVNERCVFDYGIRILRFLAMAAFTLTKRHLRGRYDVIHVHSVPDFLVFATILPKLLGARVILDIHDILPEFYASKFRVSQQSLVFQLLLFVEKVSIGFANHVIIANHLWHERLISRSMRAEKCTTIINYPDPHLFCPRPQPPSNGKFILMYPGTLNTHQGLDVAMRAFAIVAQKAPDTEFHIYGHGPSTTSLIRLADELGIVDRVKFFSFLPTKEIAAIMARADLGVVPKRASSTFGNEAASTKIMEFMSLGVPVVVSRTKIDLYYHDESRVRFFESENEADLAAAILELRYDEARRRQLAANASRYVCEHSWSNKKQEYLNLVDGLAVSASTDVKDVPKFAGSGPNCGHMQVRR
jgi:glycosyltransferase involved in cell wall biosynthesis